MTWVKAEYREYNPKKSMYVRHAQVCACALNYTFSASVS